MCMYSMHVFWFIHSLIQPVVFGLELYCSFYALKCPHCETRPKQRPILLYFILTSSYTAARYSVYIGNLSVRGNGRYTGKHTHTRTHSVTHTACVEEFEWSQSGRRVWGWSQVAFLFFSPVVGLWGGGGTPWRRRRETLTPRWNLSLCSGLCPGPAPRATLLDFVPGWCASWGAHAQVGQHTHTVKSKLIMI